jgi:hypothetical protein
VKKSIHTLVAASVANNLLLPQHCIALWCEISGAGMAVPKAAIDKHCQSRLRKNEIRLSKQRKTTTPSA